MSTVVLAVAIGVNLLVFTVVNALWIRPLPFHEPDRVVTILAEHLGWVRLDGSQLKIFEGGVAGQVITTSPFEVRRPHIEIADVGQSIEALGVTPGYFKLLGLAIRGRDFAVDDDRDGAEPVAIISDRFWSRGLGRRADVIGAVLPAKPVPIRVIGIAPKGFDGVRRGERADLWISPSLVRRLAPPDPSNVNMAMLVFARLGPAQTVAGTEQQYRELMNPRTRDFLQKNNAFADRARVVPVSEVFGTPESQTAIVREGNALIVVAGLTLLVLVGGCATIATLVLMHYERRRTELAIRMSLGASRSRLVFELARDLSWVAVLGVASGMLVAALGVRVVPALSLPGGVNIGRLDLSIDWRVSAVAIAATVITLIAAAMLPLARATRLRLAGELLAGPSAATLSSLRVRQALLAIHVSSTIVVLVAAGLFVRAVTHGFISAGFDVDRTVFASIQEGPLNRINLNEDPRPFMAERGRRLAGVLGELPGVTEVAEGIAPIGPTAAGSRTTPLTITVKDREHNLFVGVLRSSPNLLSTLGVPLLAGRALTAADTAASSPQPVIVTSSLAERLWPGGQTLGETFSMRQRGSLSYLVVGIARDFAYGSLQNPGNGAIVTIDVGYSAIVASFVLRTDEPEIVAGLIERTIPGHLVRAETGTTIVARDISRQRLGAWFFSGFGLATLILGVGGAFGLVAYLAESRRREFAVRLALGATMADLVRHGLFAALTPVALGVAIGLACGALVSRLFSAMLVGVSAMDLITYALVAVTMLACAAAAALMAAWRLRRMTPSDALRAM
jgi:putative ABC transport system permease protein